MATGIPASPGFAVGPALILTAAADVSRTVGTPEDEAAAVGDALETAAVSLERLRADSDELGADILEFQVVLLDDEALTAPVYERVVKGEPADVAWRAVIDAEIADYRSTDDVYMAARADDLIDLRDRVLKALEGGSSRPLATPKDGILLADELTPSAFLELDWQSLGGVALRRSSPTSHVAILARARGIPMITGLDEGGDVAPGDLLILDAETGALTIRPTKATLDGLEAILTETSARMAKAAVAANQAAVTRDGQPITVLINVDDPAILEGLDPACCDGIGLMRTEFLLEAGKLPTEDEQAAIYERVVRWASGRPVTIRVFDAGGDKPVPGLTLEDERNPFIGVRGLRLLLSKPDIFRIQLRALARAAVTGPLKVMLPMVTMPSELTAAAAHLDTVVAELEAEGMTCVRPALGIMVETPAAALTAESFDADFFSVGSNDLVQYVTACARDEAALTHLADPRNPAVLELIQRTVGAGERRGVDVSICGDMASDAGLIPILLGSGLRILSAAPAQVGRVKLAIAETSGPEASGDDDDGE